MERWEANEEVRTKWFKKGFEDHRAVGRFKGIAEYIGAHYVPGATLDQFYSVKSESVVWPAVITWTPTSAWRTSK